MGAATLDLPQSPRDAVFRAMETIVRTNSTFQRIVKPTSFRTWQGNPEDAKEFTIEHAPAMRWTPRNSGEDFKTPDTMAGDLMIDCEVLIRGTNSSDLSNFWWMITRCFYPPNSVLALSGMTMRNQIILNLQTAGARSGLVLFSQPAFDSNPDGVFFVGSGQIKIEIQSQLNT